MAPLSVESAFNKLLDAAGVIQRREGVKETEAQRIDDAFRLLATEPPTEPPAEPPTADSQRAKRREHYREFLQRVRKNLGLQGVVLCAVGLGPSAVSTMKDRVRVDLPHEMKERSNELENDATQNLSNEYFAKYFPTVTSTSQQDHRYQLHTKRLMGTNPGNDRSGDGQLQVPPGQAQSRDFLTGDVYELTIEDIKIIPSDQIWGQVLLTNTYNTNSAPFITIPISRRLSNQFATQRRQMM